MFVESFVPKVTISVHLMIFAVSAQFFFAVGARYPLTADTFAITMHGQWDSHSFNSVLRNNNLILKPHWPIIKSYTSTRLHLFLITYWVTLWCFIELCVHESTSASRACVSKSEYVGWKAWRNECGAGYWWEGLVWFWLFKVWDQNPGWSVSRQLSVIACGQNQKPREEYKARQAKLVLLTVPSPAVCQPAAVCSSGASSTGFLPI